MNTRRAFTLLEMLLATTLTAVLLAGVLSVSAALARDARRLQARSEQLQPDAVFNLLRWDLANASSLEQSRDARELVLYGHGALDRDTLGATGRMTRVVYAIRPGVGLVREQRYLVDPAHPRAWSELVLAGAVQIEAFPTALDLEQATLTPLKVRIELSNEKSIERTMTTR